MGHTASSNLNVLVFVGSLRRQSYNRGLLNGLLQSSEFKSSGIKAHVPDLGKIPFYNQDYEDDKKIPQQVNDLVRTSLKSQLFLFVTPEYNGSVAPALKNAFDWLSRPSPIYENKVPCFGKKAAAMSTSYISQEQIRDCIKMGAYRKLVYHEKQYYVNLGSNIFDQKTGKLTDSKQQERLIDWGKEVVDFAVKQTKESNTINPGGESGTKQ